MPEVRAARRPYSSKKGRVNDAMRGVAAPLTPSQPSIVVTQEQPPTPEITASSVEPLPEASEGDGTEREHPGTGAVGEAVEAVPDGTEYTLDTSDASTLLGVTEPEPEPEPEPQPASTVDASRYDNWTVPMLVTELERRQLPRSGAKANLIARLVQNDAGA